MIKILFTLLLFFSFVHASKIASGRQYIGGSTGTTGAYTKSDITVCESNIGQYPRGYVTSESHVSITGNEVCVKISIQGTFGSYYVYKILADYTCDPGWLWDSYYTSSPVTCITPDNGINPGCVLPEVLDTSVNPAVCSVPPCDDILPILNLNQSQCVGNYTDLSTDGSSATNYTLIWQSCDSTCRGSEGIPKDCDYLSDIWKNSCDSTIRNLSFNCSNGVVNLDRTDCKLRTNPCEDLRDSIYAKCDLATQIVLGNCKHNGLEVTSTDLKCGTDEVSQTDCNLKSHSQWDSLSNSCECIEGYTETNFGNCWADLDSNATQEEIDKDNDDKQQADIAEEEKKADKNATVSQGESLDNLEDTLSGLRKDINNTNSLLEQIKDNTSDKNITSINSETDGFIDSLTYIFNSASDGFNTIGTDFDSMRTSVDSGFTSSISSGTTPNFSYTFHGKVINIDLCSSFSQFRSIVYFISTMFFIFVGIRFFLIGFKIGL